MQLFCLDITKEWLDKASPNSHEVKELDYFEIDGEKHFVDGKMSF